MPRSTSARDAGPLPAHWRVATVAVVVAVTSLSGHWVVTGRPPALAAVVTASLLTGVVTGLLAWRLASSDRSATVLVLSGQLGFHAVFTVAGAGGCLPVLGRAASAGVDLALLRTGVDCVTSGPVDTLAVALLAGLGVLPVLAGHLLAGVLGVRGAGWVAGLVHSALVVAQALATLVTVRLSGPVAVPDADATVADTDTPHLAAPVASRPLSRRGPPRVAPA